MAHAWLRAEYAWALKHRHGGLLSMMRACDSYMRRLHRIRHMLAKQPAWEPPTASSSSSPSASVSHAEEQQVHASPSVVDAFARQRFVPTPVR
jgi:hypothetical protein